MSTVAYPRRPPFFAPKFLRLAAMAAAAMDVGPEGMALLAVIVCQEDAIRYRGPVKFYNDQLLALCGFGSRKRLVAARARAVKFGWLSYRSGAKGVPGQYLVTVPAHLTGIADGAGDEWDSDLCCSDAEHEAEQHHAYRSTSERQRNAMRNTERPPSIPTPCPDPKEDGAGKAAASSRKAKLKFDPQLIELPLNLQTERFQAAWNEWVADRVDRRKPLTENATKRQLKQLSKWGESKAIEAIDRSISNGWAGLFEPDGSARITRDGNADVPSRKQARPMRSLEECGITARAPR